MESPNDIASLEELIDQWREYVRRRQTAESVDVAGLEDRLRSHVATLVGVGLATDEAFLVAAKRVGELDNASRGFARERSDRLWRRHVPARSEPGDTGTVARKDALVALGFAVAAAVAIKVPGLFGIGMEQLPGFYLRNASLFVLPFLTGYFVWKRQLDTRFALRLAPAFVLAGVFANIYPFVPEGSTEVLAVLHLPIALWLAVGIAYAGGRWNEVSGRMDFVRFSGELFIYYVLIALGGGVLTGLMALVFQSIGVDIETFFQSWLMPCGAVGAVVVASWLVESRQGVVENMAPVLTRVFTPLFAAVLVAFLGALLWTGNGIDIEREVLIAFDLLLVVVLGLLLYSVSARDPEAPPGLFDVLQVVLLVSALLADAVALWAIAERISEFGFSPNRVAALGENVILMVNLSWSAVLYTGFLRGRSPFERLERWQTGYLPIYAAWAAIVAIVFPVLFGFA